MTGKPTVKKTDGQETDKVTDRQQETGRQKRGRQADRQATDSQTTPSFPKHPKHESPLGGVGASTHHSVPPQYVFSGG